MRDHGNCKQRGDTNSEQATAIQQVVTVCAFVGHGYYFTEFPTHVTECCEAGKSKKIEPVRISAGAAAANCPWTPYGSKRCAQQQSTRARNGAEIQEVGA